MSDRPGCNAFRLGQWVVKDSGDYTYSGEVRGVVVKRSGAIRYVVENDDGMLFIFNGGQLKAGTPGGPAGDSPMRERLWIKANVPAGCHARDAARLAVDLAARTGCGVEFRFNGVELRVVAEADPAAVVGRYERGLADRLRARQAADPGGPAGEE